MQRAILGYVALAMFVGWLTIRSFLPADESGWQAFGGALLRVSLVLGAIWLAIPNFKVLRTQVPGWLLMGTFVGLAIIVWKPQSIFFVGPLLLLMWIVGPNWLKLGRRKK